MPRTVRAYFFVSRMFQVSALIPYRCINYPRHLSKTGFNAPETSSTKCCLFNCHALLLYCPDWFGLLGLRWSTMLQARPVPLRFNAGMTPGVLPSVRSFYLDAS